MNTCDFALNQVMIIDDNQTDRYVTNYIIKKNEFAREIKEFDQAGKALEYIREHVHQPEALPQVILLDISMPLMNGFEFLERLNAVPGFQPGACKVFIHTSSHSPADLARSEDFPVVKKFISKPLSRAHLDDIMNMHLQAASVAAA